MGRRAGARVRQRRPRPADQPQRARHHRALPGAAAARPRRSAPARRCSTARSSRSRTAGPSFQRLQSRMHLASEAQVRRMAERQPVVYVIFDLLHLDGRSLLAQPYEERRARAARARPDRRGLADARPPRRRRRGDARGLARAGPRGHRRQAARLPVRARAARPALDQGQERAPGRRRGRRLDAGRGRARRPRSARWRWASTTTTASCATPARSAAGFTEAELTRVSALLAPLARDDSPFSGRQPPKRHALRRPRARGASSSTATSPRRGTLRRRPTRACATTSTPEDVARSREADGASSRASRCRAARRV